MNETINPSMVILARESRGLTQSELASNIKVTQAVISKAEAGLSPVSDSLLQKLINELKYPKEFFYETANIYPLGIHFYRKAKGIPQKDLSVIKSVTNIDRIRTENLLRATEFSVKDIPVCEIDGEKYKSPEDIARAVRMNWAVPGGRIENVTQLLESAGIIIIHYDFKTRQYDAHSIAMENGRFLIFVNSNMPGDRIRFSLAHELGHIIMHRIPHDKTEDEANKFAAEFLMPEDDIKNQFNGLNLERLSQLKRYWKVSMQSLLMRSASLNKITPRQYQYLWMQMGKYGYRLNEPRELEIPQEKSTLLQEIVEMYLRDLCYTTDQLKKFLYSDDDDFKRFHSTYRGTLRVINKLHNINSLLNN
jgi:Zn-dependent peptidase ImmA (M78 family)/DNA-binding XRE family transcriptional regulator